MKLDLECETFKKLRWQCRRGLLELDFLFSNFLEKEYPQLSPEEKTNFERLLEYSDPELLDWLVSRNSEPPQAVRKIVNLFTHFDKAIKRQNVVARE